MDVRPTRRLTELCCAAIDRFVHAYRTRNYAAGVARVFRRDIVWKLAKQFIRTDSPLGQVAEAIDQVNELPEAVQKAILAQVLNRARDKATELNETATEPVGMRPMKQYASFVLEGIDETHQQSSFSNDTTDSGIQFAFYKPPSSSSALAPGSQSSPLKGPGPVRRKRQSRRKPAQSVQVTRDNVGLIGGGSSMVINHGLGAVDVSKTAEGNLNFESSLYGVQRLQRHSSTFGQGASGLVPSLASQQNPPGFPYSVQGNDSTSSVHVHHNPPPISDSFECNSLDKLFWDTQQQIPGNINTVGLGDSSSNAGFDSGAATSMRDTHSSRSASVYHTPDSTFTRYLDLDGGDDIPQLPYDATTTHDDIRPSVLLDNTALGLVGLSSLSEMPSTSFGSQNHSFWDDAYFEGHQNFENATLNIGQDFTRLSSATSSSANPVHHTQGQAHYATQMGSLFLAQDDPMEREDSAQWCEDGRACQDGRRPENVLAYQQLLSGVRSCQMDQRGRDYQSSNGALFGLPPASSSGRNDLGTHIPVGGQLWNQGSFDAWNSVPGAVPTHQNPSNIPSQRPEPNRGPHANQPLDAYTYQNLGSSYAAMHLGHTFYGENATADHLGTPTTDNQNETLLYGQTSGQFSQRSNEQAHPPGIPVLASSMPTTGEMSHMTTNTGQATYYGPPQTRARCISHALTVGLSGPSFPLNRLDRGGTE